MASLAQSYVEDQMARTGTETDFSVIEMERIFWDAWSSSNNEEVCQGRGDTPFQQERQDAQQQLLGFASKAMALYGGTTTRPSDNEGSPMSSPPSSTVSSRGSELSPASSQEDDDIASETDDEQDDAGYLTIHRVVEEPLGLSSNSEVYGDEVTDSLKRISSLLKHEGVEVLKLGRSNKWQLRYLALSRDVMWLSKVQTFGQAPCETGSSSIGQCPRALLWLKRRTDPRAFGLDRTLKKQGRGGFLFSDMLKIQRVQAGSTTASRSFDRTLSRKLKRSFPNFFGVVVDYTFEEDDGTSSNRSVMLCFRNEDDAEAFVATTKILNGIIIREQSHCGGVFHA